MSGVDEHDGRWFALERHTGADGRVLACVALTKSAADLSFLVDGIAELVACVQRVLNAAHGPEHAGAVVLYPYHAHPYAPVTLAAVRGFVLSAAEELGSKLRLNLVVYPPGAERLDETLSYLADPLSAYVHASTISLEGAPA